MGLTPEELDKQIKDARARQEREADPLAPKGANTGNTATAKAMRAASELVAALIVGGVLGYWLDTWLHTKPLFMILLFFAGFAAGFVNIYRAQTGQAFKMNQSVDVKSEDVKKEKE